MKMKWGIGWDENITKAHAMVNVKTLNEVEGVRAMLEEFRMEDDVPVAQYGLIAKDRQSFKEAFDMIISFRGNVLDVVNWAMLNGRRYDNPRWDFIEKALHAILRPVKNPCTRRNPTTNPSFVKRKGNVQIDGLRIGRLWGSGRLVRVAEDKLRSVKKTLNQKGFKLIDIGVGFDYNSHEYTFVMSKKTKSSYQRNPEFHSQALVSKIAKYLISQKLPISETNVKVAYEVITHDFPTQRDIVDIFDDLEQQYVRRNPVKRKTHDPRRMTHNPGRMTLAKAYDLLRTKMRHREMNIIRAPQVKIRKYSKMANEPRSVIYEVEGIIPARIPGNLPTVEYFQFVVGSKYYEDGTIIG